LLTCSDRVWVMPGTMVFCILGLLLFLKSVLART
jgi:hypothetical protein